MQPGEPTSLWQRLRATASLRHLWLWGADASVSLAELTGGSSLATALEELRGRSVLVASKCQLRTALALIELDGVARRLVLCPSDVPADYVRSIIATAAVDAVVGDCLGAPDATTSIQRLVLGTPRVVPGASDRRASEQTEWILLTSGTTGVPKLVVHTLPSLVGAITPGTRLGQGAVWSTFYDIRRYGGLQILLRALLGGGSMVLSSALQPTGEFLIRAGERGVTHISGTPSHWRSALMSPSARRLAPRYIRLSGEIADQAILDQLRAAYPEAEIVHAFASTEAGVAFAVEDGLAGFPAELIAREDADVAMRIEDGSLRIRSTRTAIRYLGDRTHPLHDADGYVDTGDVVELHNGRYQFGGRRDGIINIGGLKVYPEEVESVINRHPHVRMSLVKARKSPITGAIVVAEIVVDSEARPGCPPTDTAALESEVLRMCRAELARHKVPVTVSIVHSLPVAASGKLARL